MGAVSKTSSILWVGDTYCHGGGVGFSLWEERKVELFRKDLVWGERFGGGDKWNLHSNTLPSRALDRG